MRAWGIRAVLADGNRGTNPSVRTEDRGRDAADPDTVLLIVDGVAKLANPIQLSCKRRLVSDRVVSKRDRPPRPEEVARG